MTKHLSPLQFTDALDGVASAETRAHLDGCVSCRDEVASLQQLLHDAEAADGMPEPSPMFWDHFSTRVRRATEAIPVTSSLWDRLWRPAVALSAVSAAALLVVLLRVSGIPGIPGPGSSGSDAAAMAGLSAASSSIDAGDGDPIFDLMVNMAAGLSPEAMNEITPSAFGAAGVVEALTPAERETFIRLVKKEFGGTE